MAKGVIYIMKTVVPGLIKIGKTETNQFTNRMRHLEQNGYRNITGLKRIFAIEVEDYSAKEKLLHTIFEKSKLSDTELFAVDENIVVQLLSSFDGMLVYPVEETKEEIFDEATDNSASKKIPNGTYFFSRKKKSEANKQINATAKIENGMWTILKGSLIGIIEDSGVPLTAKRIRATLPLDSNGLLLDDVDLGAVSPSLVGSVVFNSSVNGWEAWKDIKGQSVKQYQDKD